MNRFIKINLGFVLSLFTLHHASAALRTDMTPGLMAWINKNGYPRPSNPMEIDAAHKAMADDIRPAGNDSGKRVSAEELKVIARRLAIRKQEALEMLQKMLNARVITHDAKTEEDAYPDYLDRLFVKMYADIHIDTLLNTDDGTSDLHLVTETNCFNTVDSILKKALENQKLYEALNSLNKQGKKPSSLAKSENMKRVYAHYANLPEALEPAEDIFFTDSSLSSPMTTGSGSPSPKADAHNPSLTPLDSPVCRLRIEGKKLFGVDEKAEGFVEDVIVPDSSLAVDIFTDSSVDSPMTTGSGSPSPEADAHNPSLTPLDSPVCRLRKEGKKLFVPAKKTERFEQKEEKKAAVTSPNIVPVCAEKVLVEKRHVVPVWNMIKTGMTCTALALLAKAGLGGSGSATTSTDLQTLPVCHDLALTCPVDICHVPGVSAADESVMAHWKTQCPSASINQNLFDVQNRRAVRQEKIKAARSEKTRRAEAKKLAAQNAYFAEQRKILAQKREDIRSAKAAAKSMKASGGGLLSWLFGKGLC